MYIYIKSQVQFKTAPIRSSYDGFSRLPDSLKKESHLERIWTLYWKLILYKILKNILQNYLT